MRVGATDAACGRTKNTTHRMSSSRGMRQHSPRDRRVSRGKQQREKGPGATVVPSASSTGTCEKASKPKPITVHKLAIPGGQRQRRILPMPSALRIEEQGVVGAHGDDQQHAHQVQDRELLPHAAKPAATQSTARIERSEHARNAGRRSASASDRSARMAASPASESRIASRR